MLGAILRDCHPSTLHIGCFEPDVKHFRKILKRVPTELIRLVLAINLITNEPAKMRKILDSGELILLLSRLLSVKLAKRS